MTDFFATPNQPGSSGEWTPPTPPAPMPAWSGGGDGPTPPLPGPWPVRRPAPWLSGLVGALAGLLLTAGIGGLLSELDGDGGRLVAGAIAAVLVAAAAVGLPRVPSGPLRVAAITAAFGLAVLPMGFWLATASSMSLKTMLVLAVLAPTAVWAACFLLGGTRGRPVFLAGALAGVWLLMCVIAVDTGDPFAVSPAQARLSAPATAHSGLAIGATLGQAADRDGDGIPDEFDSNPDVNEFQGDFGDSGSGGETGSGIPASIDPTQLFPFLFGIGAAGTAVGVVSLLFAVSYLLAAMVFDRAGLPAAGTPFQGVGIAAALVALATLSGDLGDGGSALLVVIAGGALIWTGAGAGRRLTAWLGVLLAFSGLGGLVSSVVDGTGAEAALLLLLGAGVLAAAHATLPSDPPDGDDGEPAVAPATGPPATPVFQPPPAADPGTWAPQPLSPPELPPG